MVQAEDSSSVRTEPCVAELKQRGTLETAAFCYISASCNMFNKTWMDFSSDTSKNNSAPRTGVKLQKWFCGLVGKGQVKELEHLASIPSSV